MTARSNLLGFSQRNSKVETQTRFMQERIETLEKHLMEICNQLAMYTQRIARTRDEGDILASNFLQFAESERVNTNLRTAIATFADNFAAVQDYRDVEVQRLEAKVINEISLYGEICRKAKEELRANSAAKAKQLNKSEPTKLGEIGKSESLNDGISNVNRTYELQIDRFEQKKLFDLKRIFLEFAQVELLFHVRAVQVFSRAHKNLTLMEEDADLREFRNFLNLTHMNTPIKTSPMKKSPSHSSLPEISKPTPYLRRFNSTPSVSSTDTKASAPPIESDNEESSDDSEEIEDPKRKK